MIQIKEHSRKSFGYLAYKWEENSCNHRLWRRFLTSNPDELDGGDSLVDVGRVKGRFRVHRSAYKSPAVFAEEKKLIFNECWLYLGHKSEIPVWGDYIAHAS